MGLKNTTLNIQAYIQNANLYIVSLSCFTCSLVDAFDDKTSIYYQYIFAEKIKKSSKMKKLCKSILTAIKVLPGVVVWNCCNSHQKGFSD